MELKIMNNQNKPKVCAIIVTYNGQKYIERCLKSLLKSSYQLKIYVVDNGSTDNTLSIIKSFKEVQLLKNSENLGFGKANNIALKKAYTEGFDYFFLVNQDTRIEKNTVEELIRISQKYNDNAIISPVHFDDSERYLDLQFSKFFKKNRKDHKSFLKDFERGKLKESYKVEFVNAALWMLSRKVVETVGIFHPYFFHYGEDANYNDRAVSHGVGSVIAGRLNAVHNKVYGSHKPLNLSQYFEKEMLKIMLHPAKKKKLIPIILKCFSGSIYYLRKREYSKIPKYFSDSLKTYKRFKEKIKIETVDLSIES